jgi:phage FluMu protein Com
MKDLKCRRCNTIQIDEKIDFIKYNSVYNIHCVDCNATLYSIHEERYLKNNKQKFIKEAIDSINKKDN